MKSYLDLARINAQKNRKRSRMVVFCIILSVFLVTSVFSMANFEYIHMLDKIIKDHGNWHIVLSDVPQSEAEKVCKEADVKSVCRYDVYNYNLDKEVYLDEMPLCIIGTEESFLKDMVPGMLSEGHFPKDSSEILLSLIAKDRLGYSVGDTVTIKTPDMESKHTVCGFVEDTSNSLASGAVVSILEYNSFKMMTNKNGIECEPQYYIRFENSQKIKQTIASLMNTHGWTKENVGENTALLGVMGMSSGNYIVGLYGVAAILGILVVLAGILMISGSMNANVAERTQFFGMLRCIGASGKQIRRLVRREALFWLLIALPIGIVASVMACWIVCAVLAYGIGGEWQQMPVGRFSLTGIGAGIIMGLVTVLLAANAPARRASKVSPVVAVRGSDTKTAELNPKGFGRFSVPIRLGIYHAVSKKKNLLLLTGSFALSIVLYLFFSVMISWVGNALTTNKPYTPDISLYSDSYSEMLDGSLKEHVLQIDGVKDAYGRMHSLCDVKSDKGYKEADLISYDNLQFEWAKQELIQGDIDTVRNVPGNVMAVYEKGKNIELGDVFEVDGKDLMVAALLSDSPFSSDDVPALICSEDTMRLYTEEKGYKVLEIHLEKNAGNETVLQIQKAAEGLIVSDRRASNEETNSTYLAFSVLVYTFLGMVSMIAVCNIINSISMSVSAKQKRYGMMRAIGLDNKQMKKMIVSESLVYAVCGCISGCVFGLVLHAWFYKMAITNYWGSEWKLPIVELLIIVTIVLLSSIFAAIMPTRRLIHKSILDTINT